MSDSQITKKAMAMSIKQLMTKKPLSKITVQDIVDNCGLNRQTFYYHFQDKYDLVNWIYFTEAVESIAVYQNNSSNWSEGIRQVMLYLMKNRSFYINALNTPGQNAFDGYLFEVTHELIAQVVDDLAEGEQVNLSEKKFIANFYTHAIVGIAIEWLKNGLQETPDVICSRLRDIVAGSMKQAIYRCSHAETAVLPKLQFIEYVPAISTGLKIVV